MIFLSSTFLSFNFMNHFINGVNNSGIFFTILIIKITLTLLVKLMKQSVSVYEILQIPSFILLLQKFIKNIQVDFNI